jgi:hypothetical protein
MNNEAHNGSETMSAAQKNILSALRSMAGHLFTYSRVYGSFDGRSLEALRRRGLIEILEDGRVRVSQR